MRAAFGRSMVKARLYGFPVNDERICGERKASPLKR